MLFQLFWATREASCSERFIRSLSVVVRITRDSHFVIGVDLHGQFAKELAGRLNCLLLLLIFNFVTQIDTKEIAPAFVEQAGHGEPGPPANSNHSNLIHGC